MVGGFSFAPSTGSGRRAKSNRGAAKKHIDQTSAINIPLISDLLPPRTIKAQVRPPMVKRLGIRQSRAMEERRELLGSVSGPNRISIEFPHRPGVVPAVPANV